MSNVVVNKLERCEQHSSSTSMQANAEICALPRIVNFSIITDSVVAKATIVTDASTRRIEVQWGDGTSDIINHRPGFLASVEQLTVSSNPLPPETFELYHRYDVLYVPGVETTEIPAAQEHLVTLRVDNLDGPPDFAFEKIVIIPKYLMTLYPVTVWLEESCDHSLIRQHEFHIIQTIEDEVINDWDWSPSNSLFGKSHGLRLEGSGIAKEYEISAVLPSPIAYVKFNFTEPDWPCDDKNSFTIAVPLYHSRENENVVQRFERRSIGGCNINYSFSKAIKLLVRLPVDTSAVVHND